MDYRLEQLRFELREDPASRIFFKLGEHLRREGELDEAIDVLQQGLRQHPRYVAAWVSLGRALHDFGDGAGAVKAFLKALELDPENGVAARSAGEAAIANGDWIEAVKNLKRARGIMPQDDALDERIAFVEERLDELGMLEVKKAAPRAEPPAAPPPIEVEPSDEVFVVDDGSEDGPASGADDVFDTGSEAEAGDAEVVFDEPELIEDPIAEETDRSEEPEDRKSGDVDFEIVDDGSEDDSPFETGSIEVQPPVAHEPPPPPETPPEPVVEADIEPIFDLEAQEPVEDAGVSGDQATIEPDRSAEDVPMPTVTLARLAMEQGDFALAERTVRAVLEREPGQPDALALLETFEAQNEAEESASEASGGADERTQALQRWLEAVRLAAEKLES